MQYCRDTYYLFKSFEIIPGQEKTRSNCLGQVNFSIRQVKLEVWWSSGQEKLTSVNLLTSDNLKSKATSKLKIAR